MTIWFGLEEFVFSEELTSFGIQICSNVVKSAGLPKGEHLSGQRAYAGAFLQCYTTSPSLLPVEKVAAHLDLEDQGISSEERWRRQGNHWADVGAKHALELHPSLAPHTAEIDKVVRAARCTMRLAARLLPLWDPIDLTGVEFVRPPTEKFAPAAHVRRPWAGAWRCEVCLRGTRALCLPPPGTCSGRSKLDEGRLAALGHRVLAFDCSDRSVLFICVSC